MRRLSKGYTLSEVLVSMAIVAMLAGVLMILGSRARTSARATDCLLGLATIGKGLNLYASDHDGLYPPYAFERYGRFRENQKAFIGAVGPYGLNPRSFFCPLDRHANTDFEGEFYSFRNTSYFMGWRVYMASKIGDQGAMIFDASEAPDPGRLMIFSDMSWLETTPGEPRRRVCAHGDRSSNLFADGHVKNEVLEQP